MRRLPDLSLYLLLDPDLCRGYGLIETALAAVSGGATAVQLRDKAADTARLVETGRALLARLQGTGAALIINDDAEAAAAIGAHGLHVGQDDLAAERARAIIGPKAILGQSVETEDLARAVDPAVVDYVGAGPVFATTTKPGHKPAVGFNGLAAICAVSPVPAVAIGGLKPGHAWQALAAGAVGIAVVSAICGQPDPQAASRALRQELDGDRE